MPRILAADIGGTHSRFALFHARESCAAATELILERELTLAGRDYPDFPTALRSLFLPEKGPFLDANALPDVAVIAPAGAVQDGICPMPNLHWVIRERDIRDILTVPSIHMINDFAAQAYACLIPQAVDAAPVLPGVSRGGAPVAVMGAGTGFGQALLLDAPLPVNQDAAATHALLPPAVPLARFERVRVLPSEGGHAEFPFISEEEFDFGRFVAGRTKGARPIGDTIVSGSGLVHLMAYHAGLELSGRDAAIQAPEHPEAMAWFARFYARACRNYVLHTLALGGLYITGGMALRVPVLSHPAFAEEFTNSVAQRHLLEHVPVWHLRAPQAGLWGAAFYGLLRN